MADAPGSLSSERRTPRPESAVTDPDAPLGRDERQDAITEMLMTAGSMRIEDLSESFGVSLMTIHRDLDTLAAQGLMRKTRGTVTAVGTSLAESSAQFRTRQHSAEKAAIARAAFSFVEPGQSIILDDSTTGLHLAKLLPERQPLTLMTNFQPLLTELLGNPDLALISLGGQYYRWCSAYLGAVTLNALSRLRADVVFMSTSAITDDICFHQSHDTIMVKRAMFEAAQKRVLYADHSKFETRALHALTPLADFDAVILDDRTPKEHLRRLKQAGVNVVIAPVKD